MLIFVCHLVECFLGILLGLGFGGVGIKLKKVASSAKSVASILDLSFTVSGKPLINRINRINRIGPKIEPCGTPDVISHSVECAF
eukprot:Pgem_evm1s8748